MLKRAQALAHLSAIVYSSEPWPSVQNGKTLATAGDDTSVHFWDLATRRPIAVFPRIVDSQRQSLVFSPSGRWFASQDGQGIVSLRETTSRQVLTKLTGSFRYSPLAFSPNGRVLAVGSTMVQLRDIFTNQIMGIVPGEEWPATKRGETIDQLLFAPDGKLLFGLGDLGTVLCWHVASGTKIGGALPVLKNVYTNALAFTPEGTLLVLSRHDGLIYSFDDPMRLLLAESRGLVGDLIGDSVETRTNAAKRLTAIGAPALDTLQKAGLDHPQIQDVLTPLIATIMEASRAAKLLKSDPVTIDGLEFQLVATQWVTPAPGKAQWAEVYLHIKNKSNKAWRSAATDPQYRLGQSSRY